MARIAAPAEGPEHLYANHRYDSDRSLNHKATGPALAGPQCAHEHALSVAPFIISTRSHHEWSHTQDHRTPQKRATPTSMTHPTSLVPC